MTELYLVRHGETDWSKSGRHTSVTDLDLTDTGVLDASALQARLAGIDFGLVLTSPRLRARRTAALAGFPDAEVEPDLAEWYYGDYEGRTSNAIRTDVSDWRIWTHPIPGGESASEVLARLTRVVTRVREADIDRAICFAHGHSLRVLAVAWLGLTVKHGASFPLATGSVSILGYEKESPAIIRWNA